MKVLGISGSLRAGSHNARLLRAAADLLPPGAELEIFDGLADVPPFDEDLEQAPPAAVIALKQAVAGADAVLIATPEYNHSIPGVLKNALDWASRPAFASVMAYKPVTIMATSQGPLGGARCLEHMRVALDSMLARVTVAREVVITATPSKIRDGRLIDETSLAFACAAIEALLREIRLWRADG